MNRHTPMLPEHDVRETPPELFEKLDREFRFTLDAAANHDNTLCLKYCTAEGTFARGQWQSDLHGLQHDWAGERVWFNPPFTMIGEFVAHAWRSKAELAVGLVPATRTEQGWWQDLVEPCRDLRMPPPGVSFGLETRFLPGRIHFLENGQPILRKNKDGSLWINPKTGEPQRSSPKFGCCLLIWRR